MPNQRTAGVLLPPPAIFGLAVAVGFVINLFAPMPWPAAFSGFQEGIGWTLAALGIAVIGWASMRFTEAGTAVQPHHPTSALVTDGPYRFSRNPIYLALMILTLAMALIANTVWFAVMLAPAAFVLHVGVICREERYLDAVFGDEYRTYKARVRRYL